MRAYEQYAKAPDVPLCFIAVYDDTVKTRSDKWPRVRGICDARRHKLYRPVVGNVGLCCDV